MTLESKEQSYTSRELFKRVALATNKDKTPDEIEELMDSGIPILLKKKIQLIWNGGLHFKICK